ncbi:MAG: rod shape-determining protein MreC [Clostridiales bacterium]
MGRFFKNKITFLVFVTLTMFIVMGVSSNNGNLSWMNNSLSIISKPFQKLTLFANKKTNDFFYYFKDVDKLRNENEILKKQVDELQEETRRLNDYKIKNVELSKALKLKNSYDDYEPIGANIIAKDMGNWFSLFRIDIGSKEGVKRDFPVRTSEGLVGRIEAADVTSSKVTTIIDNGSTVSARLSKNGSYVLIKGDSELKNNGLCLMDYIDPDADITIGDIVETSGLGGIYPKGIIIGKVKQIRKSSNDFSKYAVVEPTVDFKRLDQVIVLNKKK